MVKHTMNFAIGGAAILSVLSSAIFAQGINQEGCHDERGMLCFYGVNGVVRLVDAPGYAVINWLGDRVAGQVPLQSFTLRS